VLEKGKATMKTIPEPAQKLTPAAWRKKSVTVQQALQLVQQLDELISLPNNNIRVEIEHLWQELLLEQRRINEGEMAALQDDIEYYARTRPPTLNGANGDG